MTGSVLQEDVIVGQNTVIGENSILCNVSLGSNCKLSGNVSLRDCVIHDNVHIGSNCQFKGCIIGQDVVIGANVVIHDKSVIGPGVRIKDDCNPIGPATWVVSKTPNDGFDDFEENERTVSELGSKAFLYKQKDDGEESDSEEDDEKSVSADGFEEAWGCLVLSEKDHYESCSSLTDDSEDFAPDPDPVDAEFGKFYGEVLESLQRGIEDGAEEGNLVLEINASRHAYAVTATQVVHSVIMSVLAIGSLAAKNSGSTETLLIQVKSKLNFFKKLIQKYVKTESSQLDCMRAIEMHCWRENNFIAIAQKVVHFMYDSLDILSEDAILAWYYNTENDGEISTTDANEDVSNNLRQKLESLIEWLEKESEEDDESEEEEDD